MRAENWDMDTAVAMKRLHRQVMPEIREALFMGGIQFKSDSDLIDSRIIQSHSGHKEACFQKAAIKRGRRRMRLRVRRAAWLSCQ